MKCEDCAFFAECEGEGKALGVCESYDPSDEAIKAEREAIKVNEGDAKRKGEW